LVAVDLHEDFIDEEGIAVSPVLSLQTPGIYGTELDTPEADSFITNGNASFSEQTLDISMTHIESVIDPTRYAPTKGIYAVCQGSSRLKAVHRDTLETHS
jgi:hypothetical protein